MLLQLFVRSIVKRKADTLHSQAVVVIYICRMSPVIELEKPWRDPQKYLEGRLMEATYEADLALRFLDAGLYRNAAGKAFQAFKALLAALAMKYRDALAQRYPGRKRLRSGKAVEAVDWMPSCRRASCWRWRGTSRSWRGGSCSTTPTPP
jgi:hypothetical protein